MKKTAFFLLLAPISLFAQFRVGGSLKNTGNFAGGTDYGARFYDDLQLKLNVEYRDEAWRIFGDLRLNLFYGYDETVRANPGAFIYSTQSGLNNFAIGVEAPRLYFRGLSRAGNFTLGRSYLTFGQPQLFNALEWYKNFSLMDPTATKPGVNMLAWDMGIGAYSRIKAFVGGDDTWKYPLGGVEIVFGVPRFEMGLAYQYKGDDRSVFGVNFKADLVLTFFGTYAAHLEQLTSGRGFAHYHDLSLGFDYSFPLNTSSMVIRQIFYYNSAGAKTLEELVRTPQGDWYFRSEGYSYTELSFMINEFVSFGANVIVSLMDGSGAVLPNGKFTLANNLVLDAMMAIFFGGGGSEFGPKANVVPNVNVQLKLTASF